MIRIAVVSDSHGVLRHAGAIRRQLGTVEFLLHAGDHIQDAARIANSLGVAPSKVLAVAGNCDGVRDPREQLFEIGGVRIYMTHGHHHGVKEGLQRLHDRAAEVGARVAIFGHSHVALQVEHGGILFLNPGSMTAPRAEGERPSCALLEIADGNPSARFCYLT